MNFHLDLSPRRFRSSVRIWNAKTLTIERTVVLEVLPEIGGAMDVKYIPNTKSLFLITTGTGYL
jgi:hypothetical protein